MILYFHVDLGNNKDGHNIVITNGEERVGGGRFVIRYIAATPFTAAVAEHIC